MNKQINKNIQGMKYIKISTTQKKKNEKKIYLKKIILKVTTQKYLSCHIGGYIFTFYMLMYISNDY